MDNGQLIIMKTNIFNAISFKMFVKKVIKSAKTKRKILLVLDNARYHHAVINRAFFNSIKNKIKFLFLPPYSPEINPIESFWKKTRRGVTHNRYFESLTEEGLCLERFFKKFRNPNSELKALSANY